MKSRPLNPLDCVVLADDCRRIARSTSAGAQRVMLEQIAATWDRIAADIERV